MSSWVSCQKIVFNLHKAYQLNKDLELLNFNYSVDSTAVELLKTVKDIVKEEPDTIVIMDHKPHPFPLLRMLLPRLKNKKPRIVFHVFGDFTLYYPHWNKLSELLKGYEVDFLVASDRQKHLIDKYLIPPMRSIVCPFPVDPHEFSFKPALRKTQRDEWGLEENDVAYVFTGRLSRQKRIHTLLVSFNEMLEKTGAEHAHLYIYGNPDFIGDQFLGIWETEGEYFRKIHRLYKSLPEKTQNKIHFMGAVPNAELKAVYQGADYLVNLSVHNDEDYGMSVAEAQCSGLAAILTDWGGLASFYHPEEPLMTRYVPVKIGKEAKLIHYPSIVKELIASLEKGNWYEREKLATLAANRFSVEAVQHIIKEMFNHPGETFTELSPFFHKVLETYLVKTQFYIDKKKNISKFYRDIYSSYVRNPEQTV